MFFKLFSVAVVAAVFGATSVGAQSVGQIGGPANMPPATFKGQQWVDSRGCVFLKAGYGGQTNWVPRVGRDRKALCGYPPTGSTRSAIEVATPEDMVVTKDGRTLFVAAYGSSRIGVFNTTELELNTFNPRTAYREDWRYVDGVEDGVLVVRRPNAEEVESHPVKLLRADVTRRDFQQLGLGLLISPESKVWYLWRLFGDARP